MSSASPYLFSHNKVVPMIFVELIGGELKLRPVPPPPTGGPLPRALSPIGQQLDLQRAGSSALLDEIEEKGGYTYYPDVIVPLPPPTMTLVGTVTFMQTDLKMPESASDDPYLT